MTDRSHCGGVRSAVLSEIPVVRSPSPLPNDPTTLVGSEAPTDSEAHDEVVVALVIVKSRDEPWRVGEIAVAPGEGESVVLGRGAGDTAEPRMRFFRARPSGLAPTAPLAGTAISRRQLQVTRGPRGVTFTRLGRLPLYRRGEEVDTFDALPGEVVEIGDSLSLFVVERPLFPAPLRHFPSTSQGEFGRADAFGMVGESTAAWRLRERVAFAAKAGTHVLLSGPSGSGKELAAAAIHALSSRKGQPFVSRNAATLPAGLFDAELFGHAKNYPNPGMPAREGLVGHAGDGTLFLDEIGELSEDLQAHLLRWMDSGGEYQRLGEGSSRTSRARLVAATNRAPESLKHDVLARFGSRIPLPGFEVRREDLPLLLRERTIAIARKSPELAARFVYRGSDGAEHVRVGARLLRAVLSEPLPGNARDLETLVWKAIEESPGDELDLAGSAATRGRPARTPSATSSEALSREDVLRALEANGKSVTRAARALGLSSRFALYRLMEKYEIPR